MGNVLRDVLVLTKLDDLACFIRHRKKFLSLLKFVRVVFIACVFRSTYS